MFHKYFPHFVIVRIRTRMGELDFILHYQVSCSLLYFCSLRYPYGQKSHPAKPNGFTFPQFFRTASVKPCLKTALCKLSGHRLQTSQDAIFAVYFQSRTTFFQITNVFSSANQSSKAKGGKHRDSRRSRFFPGLVAAASHR